jgi:sporulation protein YlmC with PRC-barrel domain
MAKRGSPGPRIMAADMLHGETVVDRRGEDLGVIEDIVIDVQRGAVAYAVVACGPGGRLFAIPWNAITLDTTRHRFILDAEKERFEHAPGFDKDHWPSMADPSWANKVHEFFGARPYWNETLGV